jgi:hypothetical protein
LVEQSTTAEPWEQTVQSLLRIHCQRATGADAGRHVGAMLTTVLTLLHQPDPSTVVFRTRVGLVALDLANTHSDPQLPKLCAALIATAGSDTYAARDALAHRDPEPVADPASALSASRVRPRLPPSLSV